MLFSVLWAGYRSIGAGALRAPCCRRWISAAKAPQHGAQQQMRAASCCQPTEEAQHRLVQYIWGFSLIKILSFCFLISVVGVMLFCSAATCRFVRWFNQFSSSSSLLLLFHLTWKAHARDSAVHFSCRRHAPSFNSQSIKRHDQMIDSGSATTHYGIIRPTAHAVVQQISTSLSRGCDFDRDRVRVL